MNQINLDTLLRVTSATSSGNLAPLKLQPDVQYQAMLSQNQQGQPQLQLQTPQGMTSIQLDKNQAALLDSLLHQTSPAVSVPKHSGTQTSSFQLPLHTNITVSVQAAVTNATSNTSIDPQRNHDKPQPALLVQFSLQNNGQILLQAQAKPAVQQFFIRHTEVPQLLKPLALALPSSSIQPSTSSMPSEPAQKAGVLQLPVTLARQDDQLILTLSNQRQVKLPLAWLPNAALRPQQQNVQAQLWLEPVKGQLQVSLLMDPVGPAKAVTTAAPAQMLSQTRQSARVEQVADELVNTSKVTTPQPKPPSPLQAPLLASNTASAQLATGAAIKAEVLASNTLPAVVFSPAQVRQLLPTLVDAAQLPSTKVQQANLMQWQLIAPEKNNPQWTLAVSQAAVVDEQTTAPPTTLVKIESAQFNRAVQFQPAAMAAEPAKMATRLASMDVAPLWRQLLPLSQAQVDPLRLAPELPPAVQAVLTEIRQHSIDSSKAVSQPQQLQQQLIAALQFNPQPQLQPTATPTAAATVALAIQLLLGRLAPQNTTEPKNTPAAKLQQLISQLEPPQSSQLLRQLSGHASTMQSAQLASIEPQQSGQTQSLFIQLPLLQQGDSRFVEIAVTEREAEGHRGEKKRTQWQLTMKFDLANQGKLLVQVKLTGMQVSLQFYTEQQGPLTLAQQFLPLLKDRLKMQGLEVTEAQCQLGKIPPQLYQRHHSLLAVKV